MRARCLIVAAVMGLASVGVAEAMPTAPLGTGSAAEVTPVREGCGFGAHQGRFGGCRLNRGWRGHMRGAMGGAPRGCPPGTHPTGRGFCRRNGY